MSPEPDRTDLNLENIVLAFEGGEGGERLAEGKEQESSTRASVRLVPAHVPRLFYSGPFPR